MYIIQTRWTMDEILKDFLRHVEQFHKTLRPPYWFSKTKRADVCVSNQEPITKPVLWDLKFFLWKHFLFFPWILNLYQGFCQMSNKARNWYFLYILLIFFLTSSLLSNAHARPTEKVKLQVSDFKHLQPHHDLESFHTRMSCKDYKNNPSFLHLLR